jgi:hydroxymethylpyrimidine/phosphomethylpyrimidine kinase
MSRPANDCPIPIALTIAGSDSGGGAGIQADLKSFSALGVYGASVITALTAQNTRTVSMVEPVSGPMVAAQLDAVFDDLAIGAIKIGMLASSEIAAIVACRLQGRTAPVVLDPVMIAKSGDALLADDAVETLKDRLLPLTTLLTPNIPEAARLLDVEPAQSEAEMAAQGRALLALGCDAVLVKGGHMPGPVCTDILVTERDTLRLAAPRIDTENTHGTGCSLSAGIAAGLAQSLSVEHAVRRAQSWLHGAIAAADRLAVGSGKGPVHHFHAVWSDG